MKNKLFFVLIILSLLTANSVFGQTNNKISLDIKGMDIVDVLKTLANRTGMNLIIGKNVTGRVTLFLKDVDVWDAFEIVLLANELAYQKQGEIINVMSQRDYELLYGERFQDKKQAKTIPLKYARAADLSRALNQIKTNIGRVVVDEGSNTLVLIDTPKKINEMQDFIKNADLPTQAKVFNLNYAQADKIQAKISETLTKGVGSIRIDERTNKVAVTDFPDKLDEISNIITAFDEKTPQVLIDAQIIEIKPSDKFEMGVDWDYWIEKHFRVGSSLPIGTSGRLLLGTTTASPSEKGDYKAILDLLRTIGDTKILSSPRIMVLNNQEARILVGTKDAYITSTTSLSGTTTVTSQEINFVDTGIKLYVTPTINRDGFVTMKIKPEVSSATRTSIKSEDKITEIPIVSTSETETTVMVKDGVTIIMGGLRKDEKQKTVKKIPLLGDIPLLGFLFRSTSDEAKKTELVILLTPHIMSGETPFTDFSDLKPREGAIAKMVKGEIITEKIPAPKPPEEEVSLESIEEAQEASLANLEPEEQTFEDLTQYKNFIWEKINKVASSYVSPSDIYEGSVQTSFILDSTGELKSEPVILSSTNHILSRVALKSIKEASPFPPFPAFLNKPEEGFAITFSNN